MIRGGRRIRWTKRALRRIDDIGQWISIENIRAASHVVEQIIVAAQALECILTEEDRAVWRERANSSCQVSPISSLTGLRSNTSRFSPCSTQPAVGLAGFKLSPFSYGQASASPLPNVAETDGRYGPDLETSQW